jgi:positive regulator of sigma E activity
MDDAKKKLFKGKFVRLVILLNIDVLCFFLAAILYFLLRDRIHFGTQLAVIFLVLALLLGFLVARRYRETKTWLNEHA